MSDDANQGRPHRVKRHKAHAGTNFTRERHAQQEWRSRTVSPHAVRSRPDCEPCLTIAGLAFFPETQESPSSPM